MGYYTGNGVVKGGAQDVGVIKESFLLGTLHRVYQRSSSTTTKISGVALSTAQSLCVGLANLTDLQITQSGGTATAWDVILACQGTKQSGSYSQIGDSNLYEVTLTNVTLEASESGWTS